MSVYYPLQLLKPSKAQIDDCTQRTAAAFSMATTKQTTAEKNIAIQKKEPTFIKYTTQGSKERIIEIHEEQYDPLAPSRFKLKNNLQRPPSPPPVSYVDPMLTRQGLTKEEKEQFNIPVAVTNWSNKRAYTVDLNVRALMDDKGTQLANVSTKHREMQESLGATLDMLREQVIARKEFKRKQQEEEARRQRIALENSALDIVSGAIGTGGAGGGGAGYGGGDQYGDDSEMYPTMEASGRRHEEEMMGVKVEVDIHSLQEQAKRSQAREQLSRPQRDISGPSTANRPAARYTKSLAINAGQVAQLGGGRDEDMVDDRVLDKARGEKNHDLDDTYDGQGLYEGRGNGYIQAVTDHTEEYAPVQFVQEESTVRSTTTSRPGAKTTSRPGGNVANDADRQRSRQYEQ